MYMHVLYNHIKGNIMASINMCIRIDSELKKQAEEVLSQLGMTMSGTINMFLNQIVREKSVPLNLSLSPQDRKVLADIVFAEADRRNGFKGYDSNYVLKEMDDIIAAAENK